MRGVFVLPFIGAEEFTRFPLICLIFCAYPLVVEHGENIVMAEFKAAMPRVSLSGDRTDRTEGGAADCGGLVSNVKD